MTRVKICGITRDEDLVAALDAGADALGFVVGVPSSPRNLPIERAAELVSLAPVFTKTVLVMVPNCISEIAEAWKAVRPDALQVHGHGLPSVEEIREGTPGAALIRGIRLERGEALNNVEAAAFDALLLASQSWIIPVPPCFPGTNVSSRMASKAAASTLLNASPLSSLMPLIRVAPGATSLISSTLGKP